MGVIVNGVGVGFFAAIFISLYMQGLFNFVLPLPIIYGIFAPLISAVAIFLMIISRRQEKDRNLEWWEEQKKKE